MKAEELARRMRDADQWAILWDEGDPVPQPEGLLPYAAALLEAREALAGAKALVRDATPALMFAALHVQCTQAEAEEGGARVDRIHTALARLDGLLGEAKP